VTNGGGGSTPPVECSRCRICVEQKTLMNSNKTTREGKDVGRKNIKKKKEGKME
jgi:hypothetical protein